MICAIALGMVILFFVGIPVIEFMFFPPGCVSTTGTSTPPQGSTIHRYTFSCYVLPGKVFFFNRGNATVSIYTMSGKLVYREFGAKQWNLTSLSGAEVDAGSYIAIASNTTTTVKRVLVILK
jgi:hypothetical protein